MDEQTVKIDKNYLEYLEKECDRLIEENMSLYTEIAFLEADLMAYQDQYELLLEFE